MSVNLGSAHGKIIIGAGGAMRSIGLVKSGLLGLASPFGIAKAAAIGLGVGLAGIGVAAGGLVAGIASSVKVASSLEEQMSGVKAVMGASNEEIGELKSLIMDLGIDPNLKVSALEVAQTVEMLGRNGAKTDDIMNGLARSTVLLSNATGGDFAQSADIATDVMALWKIQAEDVGRAVDGITNVVNNSKFDITDYANALASGGGVASSVGVGLEEFNTVIAGIAPSFAAGGDAGTAFKVFLQRLIPTSDKAASTMAALGLNFFDASGNMKDMGEISAMLREKLYDEFQMTVQLGGATKDMMKAAEKAKDKIPGLTSDIAEQEAKMALYQHQLEELIDKYGEGSTQVEAKRLSIMKMSNTLDENRDKLKQHQDALTAMSDATVETISTTTKLTEEQRLNTISTLFGTRGMRTASAIAAMGGVAYEDAAEAAAALGVSVDELSKYADGGITAYEALNFQITKSGTAQENAKTRMDNLIGAMKIFDGVIETLRLQIGDKFLGHLQRLFENLTGFLTRNQESIVGFFDPIADAFGKFVDRSDSLLTVIQGLWAGGNFSLEYAREQFGDFGMFLAEIVGSVKNTITDMQSAAIAFQDLWNIDESARPGEVIGEIMAQFGEAGPFIIRTVDTIKSAITDIQNGDYGAAFSALADILGDAWTSLVWPQIQQWGSDFWRWITGEGGAIENSGENIGSLITAINTLLGEQWPLIAEKLHEWADKFWGWLLGDEGQPGAIARVGEAFGRLVEEIRTWAESEEGQGKLRDLGKNLGDFIIGGIKFAVENQEKVDEVMQALGTALAASVPSLLEGLGSIGEAIATGLLESIAGNFTSDEVAEAIGSAGGKSFSFALPGFASGGIVPGPIGKPQLGVIHGGEGIIPASDMASLVSGASGGSSVSTTHSATVEGDIIINLPNVREPYDAAQAVEAKLQEMFGNAYVTD